MTSTRLATLTVKSVTSSTRSLLPRSLTPTVQHSQTHRRRQTTSQHKETSLEYQTQEQTSTESLSTSAWIKHPRLSLWITALLSVLIRSRRFLQAMELFISMLLEQAYPVVAKSQTLTSIFKDWNIPTSRLTEWLYPVALTMYAMLLMSYSLLVLFRVSSSLILTALWLLMCLVLLHRQRFLDQVAQIR